MVGSSRDAAALALGLVPGAGIHVDRVGQREALGDARETGGDQRGEREVGVAGCVGGLQLGVRGRRGHERGLWDEAQRRLAVLDAPERVRAREVAGPAAQQRGDARCGDRGERGQLADDPGEPCLAFGRQAVRVLPAGQQVLLVAQHGAVRMPAVPGCLGCHERCERGPQAVRARRRVDRLSCQQLHVGGCQGIGGADRELHLREAVLRMQLADHDAVGIEVGQELRAELVHLEHRERSVDRPVVRRRELGIGMADEPLELEPGPHLEPGLGGPLDLSLERTALAVHRASAVLLEEAARGPRERGLARELSHPVRRRTESEVARRRRERLVRERDPVGRREHGEERRDSHAALHRLVELSERHRPRARDAVVVRERDRQAAYAVKSEHRSVACRVCGVLRLARELRSDEPVVCGQPFADPPREAG